MHKFIQSVVAIALLVLLGACSRQVTVKIGVVAPMTGPSGEIGKDIANGARVAVDELNEEQFKIGGKVARFELVVEDDKGSAEEGKEAAKRLVGAGVAAVVGHLNSHVSIAAAPIYANAGIPQLSVSTNPKYTRMGLKTTFRIVADDTVQGAVLARFITEKLRAHSVFVIDDGSTFGVGLAEEALKVLKEKKIEPPHESIDIKTADLPALAQKISASKASVVFYGGDEVAGVPLMKALSAAGSTAKFVSGDGMCDMAAIKNAGGVLDSNFHCSIAGVPPSWLSSGVGFVQLYKDRFGEPGQYAPLAYNSVHIFSQAMQRAETSDPRTCAAELLKGAYDGKVQGSVEFDHKGDMKEGTIVIYKAVDGKLAEMRNAMK